MNWDVTWIHIDMEGTRAGKHCQCVVVQGSADRKILEGSIDSIAKDLYFMMSDNKDRILIIDGQPWNQELSPLYDWSKYWHGKDETKRRLIHLADGAQSWNCNCVEDDLNRIKVFRTRIPNPSF